MLKGLLANEFVVMALDGILHLISIWLLGLIVVVACKCLSRGFVNIKLWTGIAIALLLIILRLFLLNKLGTVLPEASGNVLMVLISMCLFSTCVILVYWLVSIPILGTLLSSTTIIITQLALNTYVPKLSYRLMPQGQRFAEYVGVANDRTRQLMDEAKAFQGQSGGLSKILADAAETIKFLTSGSQRDVLSKDFASAVALYKDRKAYMDNMSPEELAAYRRAMSEFLAEQGLKENRYSLSNLKNAKPDDLKNLATFMKEMNREYQLSDQMPESTSVHAEAIPPSAESLAQMAQSLSQVDLSNEDLAKLSSLFNNLGIDADSMMANMAAVNDELAGIRDLTKRMATDLRQLSEQKALSESRAVLAEERELASPYYKAEDLSPILTDQSLVLIPEKARERALWEQAANSLNIEAWFASKDHLGDATIYIQGTAVRSGDVWEQRHNGQIYRFTFRGVEKQVVTLVALERIDDSIHFYGAKP